MNAKEFLATASRLVEGETEGDWRSAISRAYYAALHVVLGRARRHVRIPGGGKAVHAAARQFLNQQGSVAAMNAFGRLFDRRVEADYKLSRKINQEAARRTVDAARRFCDEASG